MIVENAGRDEHAVGLPVKAGDDVGEHLGAGIGTLGPERGVLCLGVLFRLAEHIRSDGLKKLYLGVELSYDLEHRARRDTGDAVLVIHQVEAPAGMVLVGLVVYFVRPDLVYHPVERSGVQNVAPVQGDLIQDVFDIPGIAGRGAPDEAVHLIALF